MYQNKKFLAIIPARSGSKGVIDKNIKPLHGKPMMAYTITAAMESGIFDTVLVSTDSAAYAKIAEEHGAQVPSLRPAEFSKDNTGKEEVILYTLALLEKENKVYDYFVYLQPTSPLRTGEDIRHGVEEMLQKGKDSCVSLCPCEHPPEWNCKESNLSDLSFYNADICKIPRQQLETSYRLNGGFFISQVTRYQREKTFYTDNSVGFVMTKQHSLDIDDMDDFYLAEYYLSSKNKGE